MRTAFKILVMVSLFCAAEAAFAQSSTQPIRVVVDQPIRMTSETPPSGLAQVALVCQIVMGFASLCIFFLSFRTTHQLKRADIKMEDQRRYDALLQIRADLEGQDVTEERVRSIFFQRFWNLQNDQFRQWQDVFLRTPDYQRWLRERKREHEDERFTIRPRGIKKEIAFSDGWSQVKSRYVITDPDFGPFMELVFDGQIDEAVRKYRPKGFRARIRRLLQ